MVNGAFYIRENSGGHFDLLEKRISIDWAGFRTPTWVPPGPIVSNNSLAPPFEGRCLQAIYLPCPVIVIFVQVLQVAPLTCICFKTYVHVRAYMNTRAQVYVQEINLNSY